MQRRDVFGWVGLAVAILALGLALIPGWTSPGTGLDSRAGEPGWVGWFGRWAFGLPPATSLTDPAGPTSWRDTLSATSSILGLAALVLGIVGYVRREEARLTACCVGVAAGAIATQHPFAALLIMGFAVLTAAVLARYG